VALTGQPMMVNFVVTTQTELALGKSINFCGHTILNQLMNYINIFSFLEDPGGCWRALILENKVKKQSVFLHKEGAYF
jgi:hypothetical protein